MDWSQYRQSTNIDQQGPIASAWDNYWNNLGWKQDPFTAQADQFTRTVGGWMGGGDQQPDTSPGSLADQAGVNADMSDKGGDTSMGIPSGFEDHPPDQGGGNPNEYDWQQAAYADGGAVEDSRSIPKSSAQDSTTDHLQTALQTIDQVMQHGYQINGLGGDQPQQAQQGAIPDTGDSTGRLTAFADGGVVPTGGTPVAGFNPPSGSPTNGPTTGSATPAAGGSGSGMGGGPNSSWTGSGFSNGWQGNPNVGMYGGERVNAGSYGQGQSPFAGQRNFGGEWVRGYADGGAIPDETDDANGNPAQPTGASDWQGGIPTGQQIRGAMNQLPSPAAPFEAPVKRILNLIQGGGAMPADQAQALEKGSGIADPNAAKIFTTDMLAKTHGPDAAWSYMQSLRRQYDLNRTNAAVKAAQGNIPQATIAANHAMTNVLDGTDTRFTPVQGGVRMTVQKIGRGAKGYADGGAVSQDDEAIPTDDQQDNTAAQSGGAPLVDTVLSVPQFMEVLRGQAGQYDQIWNKGLAYVAKNLSQNPPAQQKSNAQRATEYAQSVSGGVDTASPEAMTEGSAKLGKVLAGVVNPGAIGMEPEQQAGGEPPQAAQPDQDKAQAAAVPSTSQQNATATAQPLSPREQMVKDYGEDTVRSAERQFPYASQWQQRAQYMNQQQQEAQKAERELTKTKEIWGTRERIAQSAIQGRANVQQMKNVMADKVQASRAATAMNVEAMRVGSQQDQTLAKLINGYVAAGQSIPSDLLPKATDLWNRLAEAGEQRAAGPINIQVPGGGQPAAPQPQAQAPTQVMRGPDGQLHTFVLNSAGKYVPQQ